LQLKEADFPLTTAIVNARRVIGYEGRRRTVLIADDNRDNREVLRRFLQMLGFITLEARDGEEAYACALRSLPDLIFMDLVMPGLDGFEAVRRLRAAPSTALTPIVALSASAFDDTAQKSAINGCTAFFSKPVRFEPIVEMLGRELDLVWIEKSLEPQTPAEAIGDTALGLAGIKEPDLAELLAFAQHGDIAALVRKLDAATDIEPSLLMRLRELSRRYDMKGIRDLLRTATP
jgi:CheY-like chemotaxis protein